MQFEPQCKTVADLHREWARVLDMCSNESVNPCACVKNTASKYNSIYINDIFNIIPEWSEFAIAIVEGKPVFRGDFLYEKRTGDGVTIGGKFHWDVNQLSWSKTKYKEVFYATSLPNGLIDAIQSLVGERKFSLTGLHLPTESWHTERCANEFSIHFKFKTPEEATAMEKIVLGQLSKQM